MAAQKTSLTIDPGVTARAGTGNNDRPITTTMRTKAGRVLISGEEHLFEGVRPGIHFIVEARHIDARKTNTGDEFTERLGRKACIRKRKRGGTHNRIYCLRITVEWIRGA
ncbi:hypothetical protein GL2_01720 [Microbulbifer sp. GL-2]|nr:hypothetical protein GL2_01720 [Microbulbifer sp. GL-2]